MSLARQDHGSKVSFLALHGSNNKMPKPRKSSSRVARVRPCCWAVAAIRPSKFANGRPSRCRWAVNTAQRFTITSSTGRILPGNQPGNSRFSHSSKSVRRLPKGRSSILVRFARAIKLRQDVCIEQKSAHSSMGRGYSLRRSSDKSAPANGEFIRSCARSLREGVAWCLRRCR